LQPAAWPAAVSDSVASCCGNACSAARATIGLNVEPTAIGRFHSTRSASDSPRASRSRISAA